MSKQVSTDVELFVGGYELTGSTNATVIDRGRGEGEITCFGDTAEIFAPGLKEQAFSIQGCWDDEPDARYSANMDLSDVPLIVAPKLATDGNICFMGETLQAEYNIEPKIKEVLTFSVSGKYNELVRGTVMHNAIRTATGNGVARQLGAVPATGKVYASLHVLTADGSTPTLDVTVESDDNAGMTSAVQRIAFTQAVAIGSEWMELAGANADDYWRITYTITGGSPSFNFIVAIGIR